MSEWRTTKSPSWDRITLKTKKTKAKHTKNQNEKERKGQTIFTHFTFVVFVCNNKHIYSWKLEYVRSTSVSNSLSVILPS